jgi:N-acylneuraminate cytidylyltransferase
VLAVIPARGGSRAVPGKNIRSLAGKPMIAYTIDAAHACPGLDRVIVSTDSDEIAGVAREWRAEVPFMRPAELAGDTVTDLPVFLHALEWLERSERYVPDVIVHLRPTAPLRRAEHISAALRLLEETGADSVRSVCRAGQHPHKMWQVDGPRLRPYIHGDQAIAEAYNMPRQQLPAAFVQNGSVDVAWRRTLVDQRSMTGRDIAGLVMDPLESINVDDELDLMLAELLLARQAARP